MLEYINGNKEEPPAEVKFIRCRGVDAKTWSEFVHKCAESSETQGFHLTKALAEYILKGE
jgi:hypothetical protein